MFIDVTRHGGVVLLRLAVPAIAYLTETPTGCAIHLIGGETIRANETRDEIEERVAAFTMLSAPIEGTLETLDAVVTPAPGQPLEEVVHAMPRPDTALARQPHPQKGRNKR